MASLLTNQVYATKSIRSWTTREKTHLKVIHWPSVSGVLPFEGGWKGGVKMICCPVEGQPSPLVEILVTVETKLDARWFHLLQLFKLC